MKFVQVTCFICLTFSASGLFAAGGLSRGDVYRIGISPSIYDITIGDPDGDTEKATGVNILHLIGTYDYGRDAQLFGHFFLDDYSLDPGVNTVGQDINGYGMSISYQHRLRVLRSFKPWFGAGVGMLQYDYKKRFTIDNLGFLDQSFSNRQEQLFYLTLNMNTEWQWDDSKDFIINAYINRSIDSQYTAIGLALGVLF